jgi:hypothetical protein
MIVWREKLIATAVHFFVTAVLAAIAAALIFLVWYPPPFQKLMGGTELFLLVVGCDLALGPLLSLVVYNGRKPRRKLIFDYAVIGVLQLGALVYGVLIVSGTRPVAVAFSGDRIEIVSARDVPEKNLAEARDPRYSTLPWTGPRYVFIDVPAADHNDALFASLEGNEEHLRPKFYRPYEAGLSEIRRRGGTIDQLIAKHRRDQPLIDAAVAAAGLPKERLRWLPVRTVTGFWTVLIDFDTGRPVEYFALDPY